MFTESKILNLSKDYKYVYLDENESPCVANVEIHQIIEDKDIHKWSVQTIRKMYNLSFAQTHSALAFIFDSEEEEKRAMDYGREYHRKLESVDGYKYVVIDEKGILLIKPTKTKIIELISERRAYKWGAKKQQEEHSYLILSQVHSALSYYFDHKKEIEEDIKRRDEFVEEMQRTMGQNPIAERLKAMREAKCR
jgi:hypothetical protein